MVCVTCPGGVLAVQVGGVSYSGECQPCPGGSVSCPEGGALAIQGSVSPVQGEC